MIFIYLYTAMSIKHVLSITIMSLLAAPTVTAAAQSELESVPDTIFFDDGSVYIGTIADSLFNGQGTMIYADSTIYQGDWKNGMWDGSGTVTYPDGDSYTGSFKEQEFSGYGVYLYSDGAKYDGYWQNGMFNGAGTMDYNDGSTYTGLWQNDMKEGLGIYYDAFEDTLYKGYFHQDRFISTDHDQYNASLNPNSSIPSFPQNTLFYEPQISQNRVYIGVSFGLGQIFDIQIDFGRATGLFLGFNLGFNASGHGIGQESVTYDDETGEKITLVGWDWFLDEVVTEKTYPRAQLMAESGWRWNRFNLGAAAGLTLNSTYRNCRGGQGSYFESGELYYREKITGAGFCYRVFCDMVLKDYEQDFWSDLRKVSLRVGYGNADGAFIGFGISF